MATITDKAIQAKPTKTDQWLTQPFKRGAGVFLARITPAAERLFYFRYTDSNGRRPFLPIGHYHPKGNKGGLTLAAAYKKASDLSGLYQSGIRDLKEHFAAQDASKVADLEAQKQQAANDQIAADLERDRRITVRMLFDRWAEIELKPHIRADGKRLGRKDAGAYTRAQFERRIFDKLGNQEARSVKKADLLAILDEAKSDGKLRTANMLLADLKQMFRFALARDIVERNPLDTVTKRDVGGADVERDRVLTAEEVAALVKALPKANLSKQSETALWLILATGSHGFCRKQCLLRRTMVENRQREVSKEPSGQTCNTTPCKNSRPSSHRLAVHACCSPGTPLESVEVAYPGASTVLSAPCGSSSHQSRLPKPPATHPQ